MDKYHDLLGKPDLKIAELQIWIHGREHEDDNWLIVTMHCGRGHSDVWIKYNAALNVYYDFKSFITDLNNINNGSINKVIRQFTEPYLALELERNPLQPKTTGEIELTVRITPNVVNEEHKYVFSVSEKEIESFINELKGVLSKYPIKPI